MTFIPEEHMIKVAGNRKYLPVAARLVWFREEHPDWGIITQPVEINTEKQYAIFSASIFSVDGKLMATATKMENVKGFGDWLEKAETGAVGRALAYCGYGTQFAPEMDEAPPVIAGAYGSQSFAASQKAAAPARITSAPNPPKPPADPELRAAIAEFVTVWNDELVPVSGAVLDVATPITNKAEREAAMALWFGVDGLQDSSWDAGHYRQSTQEIRERLAVVAEARAAEAAAKVEVRAPAPETEPETETETDLSDLTDPFAEPAQEVRHTPPHEAETALKQGRRK